MDNINQLRSERARVNQSVQALALIEAGGGTLTAEQLAEFTRLQGEFDALTERISRVEAAERMQAASAQPVDQAEAGTQSVARGPATGSGPALKVPERPGFKMARMVRALILARGDQRQAANIADQQGFGADVAMALNTLTPGAGGVLVPEQMSSEIIELFRPKAVVRRLGARSLPLMHGNITLPRLKGGAVVGYIGSDTDIPVTQPEFDDLTLSAKTLAALVPISNDLLRYSGVNPNVDAIVVGDLTTAIAAREDLAFIRGTGASNTPKGLGGWVLVGNTFDQNATVNLQNVENDLNKAVLLLEGKDANMIEPGWIMAPRTYRFLEGLRNANGVKVYPTLEGQKPTLKGYPVGVTTQVPVNLGSGTNESEIYFTDFGDLFIGEDAELILDYSKEASYTDGANTVSAFQRNQTLIRVIAKHDFGPRHVESIAKISKVTWGG